MPRFVSIVEWVDADVNDADEVADWATNAEEAARKAKRLWRTTKGVEWPAARIVRVQVFSSREFRELLDSQ